MSTNYELIDKQGGGVEITEHSCLFDIAIYSGTIEPEWCEVNNLTLDDLKEVNQKITNIISYFDPDYKGCEVKY